MRKFESVIDTEETALEEKPNDVLTMGVNRAPKVKYNTPEGKGYIEYGREKQ